MDPSVDSLELKYLRALLEGNLAVVEAFLGLGVPVDRMFHFSGKSGAALHLAASTGQTAVVDRLLAAQADVNRQQDEGATPLFLASEFGHHRVVDRLIAAPGCDVNLQMYSGDAPLHIASEKGHWRVVDRLTAAGADVNLSQEDGCSALYFAAQGGRVKTVARLLAAQADPDQQRSSGETALHAAVQSGRAGAVAALLAAQASVSRVTAKGGETALHFAAQSGQLRAVRALVSAGADVNARATNGCTPVHTAAQNGHLAVVEALLAAQANVNITEVAGVSPLYAAAQNGHQRVVEALVRSQADVDHRLPEGLSTLYIAAQESHWDVVQLLVRSGATVDQQAATGESPMHIAALQGDQLTLAALMQAAGGCTVDLRQQDGCTPLYLAAQAGHVRAVEALVQGLADVNAPRLPTGQSPLHIAAELGHCQVAVALIRGLADVSSLTRSGLSPLDVARRHGQTAMAEALVRAQADDSLWRGKLPAEPSAVSQNDSATRENVSELPDTISCTELSRQLHSSLAAAGFVQSRAALQGACADVLQEVLRRRIRSDEVFVVGSYSEGWGNSLSRVDGRTDVASDIDVTQLIDGRLYHLIGSCQCKQLESDELVDYANGHIICRGYASSPARPERGSALRPAVDRVAACRLCCYPPIAPLLPPRVSESNIPQSVLKSLEQELTTSTCHVVHAAPPGQAGQQLRVSTTFLEKRLLRSLSTLQGQLFVTLKYLVKKVIHSRVQGLKAYHAKSITFRMLEETPAGQWQQPENLVSLTRRSLQILHDSVESSCIKGNVHTDSRIMEHFFLSDAALYLKGAGRSGAHEITRVLRDVMDHLPQLLMQFKDSLKPLTNCGRFYFHPFLILPEIDPQFSLKFECRDYSEIYDVVRESLLHLSEGDCSPESQLQLTEMIGRLPDCARSAREALRALACLKFGYRDAAVKVLRYCRGHEVSRGIDWSAERSVTEATADLVWQHLRSCDSAWKFSLMYLRRPNFSSFMPGVLAQWFPLEMKNYAAYCYINFDALLLCLRLELLASEFCDVRSWFVNLLRRDHEPDLQELLSALHFCGDIDLLSQLISRHRSVIEEEELTSRELASLTMRLAMLR